MSLDFKQVREQVKQLGEAALQRQQRLIDLRKQACDVLEQNASQLDPLRRKVQRVVKEYDPNLRCAMPFQEPLDAHFPTPGLPSTATVIAADGSQIFMDRHAEVEYALINVGAIQMQLGTPQPPLTQITSQLLYYEQAENLSEATLALRRDLNERKRLDELASGLQPPVITFTDGPMELVWARVEGSGEASAFQKSLEEYLQVLAHLGSSQVTTAGYVDKPGADLVVRLLEVAMASETDLANIRKSRPLRGVRDRDLYTDLLQPGERSAVLTLQSPSARNYQGSLALHFFYLNVGLRPNKPWLARVEIPAWVAENPAMLDSLHAVLIGQCRMMGEHPYPYLLHRAHETAVVNRQEQEQVTQMIVLELRRLGINIEGKSQKQELKDSAERTRYKP